MAWGVRARMTNPIIVDPVRDRENHLVNLVRLVSALLVAVGHARWAMLVDYDAAPQGFLQTLLFAVTSLGKQAVVVFFVLSGYWVGGTVLRHLRRESFTPTAYLSDRWVRLSLVLFPAILLTWVLDVAGGQLFPAADVYNGHTLNQPGVEPGYGRHDAATFVGNLFYVQGLLVPAFGTNNSLWSIGYEFWMYVIGAAIIVAARRRTAVTVTLAAGLFALGGMLGTALWWYLPTWLVGAAVAAVEPLILKRAAMRPALVAPARLVAVLATLATALIARSLSAGLNWVGVYGVAAISAVLIATLIARPQTTSEKKWFSWASVFAASCYSLYAIHAPILVFVVALLGLQTDSRLAADAGGWLALAALSIFLVICGWVFAQATERHTGAVRDWLRAQLANRAAATRARGDAM